MVPGGAGGDPGGGRTPDQPCRGAAGHGGRGPHRDPSLRRDRRRSPARRLQGRNRSPRDRRRLSGPRAFDLQPWHPRGRRPDPDRQGLSVHDRSPRRPRRRCGRQCHLRQSGHPGRPYGDRRPGFPRRAVRRAPVRPGGAGGDHRRPGGGDPRRHPLWFGLGQPRAPAWAQSRRPQAQGLRQVGDPPPAGGLPRPV